MSYPARAEGFGKYDNVFPNCKIITILAIFQLTLLSLKLCFLSMKYAQLLVQICKKCILTVDWFHIYASAAFYFTIPDFHINIGLSINYLSIYLLLNKGKLIEQPRRVLIPLSLPWVLQWNKRKHYIAKSLKLTNGNFTIYVIEQRI